VEHIHLTINGRSITAKPGATVLEASQAAGIHIPTLCHDPDLTPSGACRLCVVDIEGVRGLPTSCTTQAREGMVVQTHTDEITRIRRTIVELAIARHPLTCLTCDKSADCELLALARELNVSQETVARLRRTTQPALPIDTSNPAFDFDPNKCVLCGKCVRTCHELVGRGAIDFSHRGEDTRISPFGAKLWVDSTCQTCGECVSRCPTGALVVKNAPVAHREVRTICPYCGVGCAIHVGIQGNTLVSVRADEKSPVNEGELCVKGRFGLDFVNHSDRLTRPLIRKDGASKTDVFDPPSDAFREADWDEALSLVAENLSVVRDRHGPDSIGLLSSAKCTNEDNYIFQKLARAGLGTNNVDHCARLCHSSTVVAALAAFGDGAMSNSISDVDHADVVFVIGSNTTECHPILGRKIKRAVREGRTRLIVADPRGVELSEQAEVHLDLLPGTDVALLNGIMRQVVDAGLTDEPFISERCEGYEPLLQSLEPYTLEQVEGTTGVSGHKIRQAAKIFGQARAAMILYGMGITQHTTGTDNVKAVANLLMLTGNLGRRGTGFSPLRGQNNVQGACDMGALPNVYPGYQRVNDPVAQAKFEKAWGRPLSPSPGLTMTEMFGAAHQGDMRAMYIMGENPLMSEADLNHARQALARLDLLVVQDLFLTETAQVADVVLPAASFAEKDGTFTNTERRIQRVRRAIDSPGQARADGEIVANIATRLGYPMDRTSPSELMDEIADLAPIYGGVHFDRLDDAGLQWPCWDREHPGTDTLHVDGFTRGRGKFHVVLDQPPSELPSGAYPLLLTTGRILEHWHTGSISRRSRVLESLVSESRVELSPVDTDRLGIESGDLVCLESRRGKLRTKVTRTDRVQPGQAFMAFHWSDAPVNLLTNPAVDPVAKIPEYKVASIHAVLDVLDRASKDNAFLAALAENPAGVLDRFNLSSEHRAALSAGDISSLERWVGPLEPRLRDWLKDRLAQESW
jgi:formate dehydrogenase alpha subunit